MNRNLALLFLLFVLLGCGSLVSKRAYFEASSSNKSLNLQVWEQDGALFYTLKKGVIPIIDTSTLGVVTKEQSFEKVKTFTQLGQKTRNEQYSLLHGKIKNVAYQATEIKFEAKMESGATLGIEFQLSETGFA